MDKVKATLLMQSLFGKVKDPQGTTSFAGLSSTAQDLIVRALLGEDLKKESAEISDTVRGELADWLEAEEKRHPRGHGIDYIRPKTRAELCDLLRDNVPCEIALIDVGITMKMLVELLDFSDFSVHPSSNDGWAVFVPTNWE